MQPEVPKFAEGDIKPKKKTNKQTKKQTNIQITKVSKKCLSTWLVQLPFSDRLPFIQVTKGVGKGMITTQILATCVESKI